MCYKTFSHNFGTTFIWLTHTHTHTIVSPSDATARVCVSANRRRRLVSKIRVHTHFEHRSEKNYSRADAFWAINNSTTADAQHSHTIAVLRDDHLCASLSRARVCVCVDLGARTSIGVSRELNNGTTRDE